MPTVATPTPPSWPASTRAGRSSRPTCSWASCARSPRPSRAARLTDATLDIGSGDELYVIAAAVVGGTSFAGGIGTIPGAVLGAFVLQSLAYGLSFLGVNSPGQNIVAGVVLVVAVGLDTLTAGAAS